MGYLWSRTQTPWKNQKGVWQHVIYCCVSTHCTVHANQVTEFKHGTLIENMLMKQWHLLI